MNSLCWPALAYTLFSWHGKPRVLLNRVFIQGEREVSSKNSLKTKRFCKIPNVCKNTNILYSVPKCPVNITFFLYIRVMTSLDSNLPTSRDCSFPLASLSKLTSVGTHSKLTSVGRPGNSFPVRKGARLALQEPGIRSL